MRKILLSVAFASLALPALAGGDYIKPVQDKLTQTECSACHMAFPPSLLPMRSWTAIIDGLSDHFGEDASLDAASREAITAYLVGAAGDANGRKYRVAPADATPLRITELFWFKHEHSGEVSPRMLKKAGSLANCTACHRGAEQGMFDDD